VQEDLARVVAVLHGHAVEPVDHHRHVHLVRERLLERPLRRAEVGLGRVDAREHHAAAPIHHVPEELERVLALLVRLQLEPVREPRQRLLLAIGGHREIQL
jgi:hypothetical protein